MSRGMLGGSRGDGGFGNGGQVTTMIVGVGWGGHIVGLLVVQEGCDASGSTGSGCSDGGGDCGPV